MKPVVYNIVTWKCLVTQAPIAIANHDKPLELFHLMTQAIKSTHVQRKPPATHAATIIVVLLSSVNQGHEKKSVMACR